jgi:hypothetical protein
MDRAAIGMGSLFMKLDIKLNWHQLFNEMIKDFDGNKVQINQKKVLS